MDPSTSLHTHGAKLFNMWLSLVAFLLLFSGVHGASSDHRFDNTSAAVAGFDFLLLGSPSIGLKARQELECSVPGGGEYFLLVLFCSSLSLTLNFALLIRNLRCTDLLQARPALCMCSSSFEVL
jgi:hypothetical protein